MSWDDLLAAAAVGTDRRGGTGAEDLLAAAAAATAYHRAGATPATGVATPGPAPDESAPVVGAAAANRLAVLLDTSLPVGPDGPDAATRAELLLDWLRLVADRGRRVPAAQLPALLDAGSRRRALRPVIVAAGGACAGWLAAQRPEWDYLTGVADARAADDPATWSQGTLGQRIGYLTTARQRDPAAARELLRAEWSGLPPDERISLIGVLAERLGDGDEEFLETTLDDRRREVRHTAAELLGRLPGSRYAARMVERARACLRPDGRTVRVDPPAECDAAMRRDGIAAKPPAGTGERAWWLEEVLARTPLPTWDPDLARARVADGWAGPVRRGLSRAAATQRDPGWAAALLDQLTPAAQATRGGAADRQLVESLYPALAPDELLARAERGLRKDPTGTIGLARLLALCPAPWPDRFGQQVVHGLAALATRHRNAGYLLDELCRIAALRLPPHLSQAVAERAAAGSTDDHRLRTLDRLAGTLRFRHDMTEELA